MATRTIDEAFGINSPPSVAKISGHLVVTILMTVMKSGSGGVPKELWGLSRALDLVAPRGFVIDKEDSFKCYCERSIGTCRYPIIIHPGIRCVVLDKPFDQPLLVTVGVERVKIGRDFDSSLILPLGLKELEFDDETFTCFNQTLSLPESLRRLILSTRYNLPITLPENLEYLKICGAFRQALKLPLMLKVLDLRASDFNHQLHLPEHLQELYLDCDYRQPITFPNSVHTAVLGGGVRGFGTFGTGLKNLTWWPNFAVLLPESLKQLTLGVDFEQDLELEEGLEELTFLGKYTLPLTLPSSLKSIMFNHEYELPLCLPDGCVRHDPHVDPDGLSFGDPDFDHTDY